MEKSFYSVKDMIILIMLVILVVLLQVNKAHGQNAINTTSGAVIYVESGATLYTTGSVVLSAGSFLQNSGTVVVDKPSGGTADFTDNFVGSYAYGSGKFVFKGSGGQVIRSRSVFGRIDIENTVTLASPVLSSKWYLKSGRVITTSSFYVYTNNTLADAIEADPSNPGFVNSWIHGNLRRDITPATVNSYVFPVGNDLHSNVAEFDNLTADPLIGVTSIFIGFGPKSGTDAGLNVVEQGTRYSGVNVGGEWRIVPDATPAGGHYDLKLYFTGFPSLIDNSFGILRRTDGSSNAADWQLPTGSVLPAGGSPGRMVADGYARRNHIAGFSQFGIGMTSHALPLQLLAFTAQKAGSNVLVKWTTTNEMNTSHFELFKGQPSTSMNYLDRVNAMGNTTSDHDYSYTDQQPYAGINLYRLKMIDIDGRFTWSPTVQVDFDESTSLKVFPNPVLHHEVFIDLTDIRVRSIRLTGVDGKSVNTSWSAVSSSRVKMNLPASLARGIYTINITTDKGDKKALIVVQ